MKIDLVSDAKADVESKKLLEAIRASFGMVPNVYAVLGHSSLVLGAYLAFANSLNTSTLSAALREKIALAVSGHNECDYCKRAHFVVGRSVGVAPNELKQNIEGLSPENAHRIALKLAVEIAASKGKASDETLGQAIATYGEKGVVEIFGVVMSTMFTNYFNHLARTPVDFPQIS